MIEIRRSPSTPPSPLTAAIRGGALPLSRVEESLTNIAKHSGARSHASASAATPMAALLVEDSGSGFDAATLQSRAGLGFVSMQERLRVIRGTIVVDSAPSRGTRIEVWVPAASLRVRIRRRERGDASRTARRRRGHPMTRPRILLADDHTMMAEALRALLRQSSTSVVPVSDGRALLRAAAAEARRGGGRHRHATLERTRRRRTVEGAAAEIRIIYLTQNREPRYAVEAFRRKASGYLLKDSAASELTTAIRDALQGRCYISPLIAGDVVAGRWAEHDPQCAT
jgi:CheY-like chemotaxis protein